MTKLRKLERQGWLPRGNGATILDREILGSVIWPCLTRKTRKFKIERERER